MLFITLKDHKENFMNDPKCRLINPAKSQVGIISKKIIQNINAKIREKTNLKQWQSTKQVLEWFKKIENKKESTFLQLDIKEYYPSISEELLEKAFAFAERQGFAFTKPQQDIIRNARRSLLYARSSPVGDHKPWQKKKSDFDVTMGAPDGAEICELVGLYILDEIRKKFPELNFGLYRDDGLAAHKKMAGRRLEKTKQKLEKMFEKEFGLEITIEMNLSQVDFLDVTLILTTQDFKPYKKPNDTPLYVNTQSNHPPTVLSQIPEGINARLSTISSKEEHFDNAKQIYQKALKESGHTHELQYKPPEERQCRRRNKREITYFNPPFNQGISTNIGRQFLALVKTHFPKNHILHTVCNRSTIKISYSCTKNLKAIIQTHNQKILSKQKPPPAEVKTCNCQRRRKDQCPLRGSCLQENVIYEATTAENPPKMYIGSTENFKKRYTSHTHSFRHESHMNSTTLSHHIWKQNLGTEPELTWDIIDRAPPYKKGNRDCCLCLTEKLHIMYQVNNPAYLNKWKELAQKCRHRVKF